MAPRLRDDPVTRATLPLNSLSICRFTPPSPVAQLLRAQLLNHSARDGRGAGDVRAPLLPEILESGIFEVPAIGVEIRDQHPFDVVVRGRPIAFQQTFETSNPVLDDAGDSRSSRVIDVPDPVLVC